MRSLVTKVAFLSAFFWAWTSGAFFSGIDADGHKLIPGASQYRDLGFIPDASYKRIVQKEGR